MRSVYPFNIAHTRVDNALLLRYLSLVCFFGKGLLIRTKKSLSFYKEFMEKEIYRITEDLMIGDLKIVQDKRLYRFTSDSILLSRFADCINHEKVADFCAGSGIVGLHYYGLNADKVDKVDLFELQPELCELAHTSIQINRLEDKFSVIEGKLQNAPADFNGKYSLVLCNPPYKKKNSGEQGLSDHIAICRHEVEITLEEIIRTAARLLAYGGRLCICQKLERFTDVIYYMKNNGIEPCDIAFVRTKPEKPPYLVMVKGVKGKKPQLKQIGELING